MGGTATFTLRTLGGDTLQLTYATPGPGLPTAATVEITLVLAGARRTRGPLVARVYAADLAPTLAALGILCRDK